MMNRRMSAKDRTEGAARRPPRSGSRCATADDGYRRLDRIEASSHQPRWQAGLAAVSLALLVIAFLVPDEIGAVVAASGLAGLLLVRISLI